MVAFVGKDILEDDIVSESSDIFIPSKRQERLGINTRRREYPMRFKIIVYDNEGNSKTTVYDDRTQEIMYTY